MTARLLFAAAIVALLAPGAARADFAAGVEAYDGGDYETAFAEWHALARAGDPIGQTAIASMYRFGEGRPVDLRESARWYRRAAEQGEAIAQLNLGEMHMLGMGVARDVEQAYLWMALAARQGNGWAAQQRDALARGMSRAQLRRTRTRVRSWQAR